MAICVCYIIIDTMEVGDFLVAMHILQLFRNIWFIHESSNCSLPPWLYPVAQLIFIIKSSFPRQCFYSNIGL